MSRVGIVTLTGSENYGNVLQNYALQKVLSEYGIIADTIENKTRIGHYMLPVKRMKKLKPSYIIRYLKNQLNYRYNIKNTGQGLVRTLKFCKKNQAEVEKVKKNRRQVFQEFSKKYIRWSDMTLDINFPWSSEQTDTYDFYITGSDQVWNPVYPDVSSINFLQFAPQNKRIAIAPSFGVEEIPEHMKKHYAAWLKEIPYLSVREEKGKEIIQELTGREAVVLCDPTMALKLDAWIQLEKKPACLERDSSYMLTYFLGNRTKKYENYIKNIAENIGMDVLHIFDVTDLKGYDVSPQEFLYLIHHAAVVCTDSFHGIVFSIMMHTNFISFPRIEDGASMESRTETLLSTFHLEHRDYRKVTIQEIFSTDFSDIDQILQMKRNEFGTFIKKSVEAGQQSAAQKKKENPMFIEKAKCFGCNACYNACPIKCLAMEEDEEGFLYPHIDMTRCIHCNKCHQVCPIKNTYNAKSFSSNVHSFVGYSNRAEIRKTSSSGGIFSELARCVIENGGAVAGAGFDKDYRVVHSVSHDLAGIHSFQGSKYVQSDMGTVYAQIKQMLNTKSMVYFSGTPCQVKGLRAFLGGKEYENLILQDVVCHGVPSPAVWRSYVRRWNNVKHVSFRDKACGWHYFSMKVESCSKLYCKRMDEDEYLRLFLDNLILRPVCYDCPMKEEGSCADLTLADCWNPQKLTNNIKDDDKGISLVITHTDKGQQLWEKLRSRVEYEEVDAKEALSSQEAIHSSAKMNPERAAFFQMFCDDSSSTIRNRWYQDSAIKILKKKYIFLKTKLYLRIKR